MLPDEIRALPGAVTARTSAGLIVPTAADDGVDFASTMAQIERELILKYLEKAGGNKRQAARMLRLSRTTLIDKLHRLGVADAQSAVA
jgi:DNA-binding NtrC family response regulator